MRNSKRDIAVAILCGIFSGLSFLAPNLFFFIWFSLIGLFLVSLKERTIFSLASLWFITGFFFNLTVLFWVGYVSLLGMTLLILYLSFYWYIFGIAIFYFLKKRFSLFTLPLIWIYLEFSREHLSTGFGWGILGYSQYTTLIAQTADILGTKYISFLIILVNLGIAKFIFSRMRQKRGLIAVGLILLVSLIYASYRKGYFEKIKPNHIKVNIVQPNIVQELKWASHYRLQIVDILVEQMKKITEGFIVFPEASWPFVLDGTNYFLFREFLKIANSPLLIGAVLENEGKFFNTAIFCNRGKCNVYRKIKLVPFGEYVPFKNILRFIPVLNKIGDISKGDMFVKFSIQRYIFSVLICFEDTFPYFVRKMAQRRDFLVNITNDAWFKGKPQSTQHLGIMVMRAIENRISILRAANTGISGWVSFSGKINKFVRDGKDIFVRGVYTTDVPVLTTESIYRKYGDWFIFVTIPIVVIIFIFDRQKKRRILWKG